MRAFLAVLLVGLVVVFAGWHWLGGRTVFPSDVYVWQREGGDRVADAVRASAPDIQQWHVLAGELQLDGSWQDSRVEAGGGAELGALAGRPVIAVFRLDGVVTVWNPEDIVRHILERREAWQRLGLKVSAVEIDHDCGTARLGEYALFLVRLRDALPRYVGIWMTALPSWIGSRDLRGVLDKVDHVVLQVHAVQNPAFGLFGRVQAMEWLNRFGVVCPKPWRVALPTYGTRVIWGKDGHIRGIESETPRLMGGDAGRELIVQPVEVARFMEDVERAPPRGFEGWVWFRLPVAGDRRSWSLEGWRDVLARRALQGDVRVEAGEEEPGLYGVSVVNGGSVDWMMPEGVRIEGGCLGAGSLGGYRLEYDGRGPWLRRGQPFLLPPGMHLKIGWLRCEKGRSDVHVGIR